MPRCVTAFGCLQVATAGGYTEYLFNIAGRTSHALRQKSGICYYKQMTYEELKHRAVEVRARYDALNAGRGVIWDEQNFMAGFVGDVGDLSKIIMAKHGLRHMDNIDEKLAHELSDCLWSILILADIYKIDLPQEFMNTMDMLEKRIGTEEHTHKIS